MIWYILSVFSIILYFISLLGATVSSKRQVYKHIFFAISILTVGLSWGAFLESWFVVLLYLAIALEAYHNLELKITDLIVRALFCFILIFGLSSQMDIPTTLIFIPSAILLTLVLYRENISFYIVILKTVAIVNSLFFLLVSYSSLAWLNPSFILPETIVPAEIFYLDHTAFFISLTLLACLFSLSIPSSQARSIDAPLIIGGSLLLSAVPVGLADSMFSSGITLAYILVILPIFLNVFQLKKLSDRLVDQSFTVGLILLAFDSGAAGDFQILFVLVLAIILISQTFLHYSYMVRFTGQARIIKDVILLVVIFHVSMSTNLKWLSIGLTALCLFDLIKTLNKTIWIGEMNQEHKKC